MGRLVVTNLTKKFGKLTAVDDLSLTVENGEFLTVVGPSGCGKTTFLRMVAGFIEPSWGRIVIDDEVVSEKGGASKYVMPENRDIGMVFQSYAVWPHMNVYNNVAYPLKIRHMNKQEIKNRVSKVLAMVGLSEYEKRMTYEMSGGQQQRVALARALVMEPRLLLLDEPLSNLDAALREQMRIEIKGIQKSTGITIINVTHDQTEAMTMSDKVAIMKGGKLIQMGTPRELYENPKNSFVAGFVGSSNVIGAKCEDGHPDADGMMKASVFGNTAVKVPYVRNANTDGMISFHPQNIKYDPDSMLKFSVSSVQYLGNEYDYILAKDDAAVRMRSTCVFDLGDEIPVRIEKAIWLDE